MCDYPWPIHSADPLKQQDDHPIVVRHCVNG
jgi:hypothetical protein